MLFASSSAPDEVWATTSSVLSSFIGSEQVTTSFPDRSPACFRTSSNRSQCTASNNASAPCAASRGLARRAGPRLASRLACEPLELLLAAGIAEDHFVSGTGEDRSELGAHQACTEHADSHAALPVSV